MAHIPIHQRGYTNPQLLAESDWLAAHLNDPVVRIVDARPLQHLDWLELIDPAVKTFKSAAELRALLESKASRQNDK